MPKNPNSAAGPENTVAPIESEIRRILQVVKEYYDRHIHQKWVGAYKDYLLYTVDRAIEIEDFQTNVKMPIVKMYVDTMWTSIYDNDFSFRVSGRTRSDHKKASSVLNFMEWAFSVSRNREELMQSLKEALITGNGYFKAGFVDQTTEVEFKKGLTEKKSYSLKEQYPTMRYVSCFNVFHDPSAKSIEASRYVIERNIMHRDDLVRNYSAFVSDLEAKAVAFARNPYYFFSYDFERVKYLAFWNDQLVSNNLTLPQSGLFPNDANFDFSTYYKNFLTPHYEGGYHEVIEYWENDRFVLIVDGSTAYDGENPLPIKRKPYYDLLYNKIPGLPFGQGMAVNLSDIQGLADTIFNLMADNLKMQVAPMFTKIKGADFMSSGSEVLTYEPFKVVETNSPDGLKRMELGTPDFTGVNFMDYLFRLGEMSEGVNSYAVGYQDKIERSATGVSARLQSFKARLLPLMDSLNASLSAVCETWTVLAVTLMDESIEAKIKDDNGNPKFMDIKPEELIGKFDLEFDAQALKTATREMRRKQTMDLITLANQSGQDPTTQQFFVDMRALWRILLDSYEIAPDEVVLSEKQVAKAAAKATAVTQAAAESEGRKKDQYFSQPAGQNVTSNVNQNVGDEVNENVVHMIDTPMGQDNDLPPEAELLRESFQV